MHAFKAVNWFDIPWGQHESRTDGSVGHVRSVAALDSQEGKPPGAVRKIPTTWRECGAVYYQGWHHICFQFNPWADTWGDGVGWGHARSKDLVHGECLPPALLPDKANDSVILLAWISGFKSGRGWNGCMSLPRILSLDGDEIIQTPIPELAELRVEETNEADSLEIIAEFKAGTIGRYGLKFGSISVVCDGDKLNVAGTEVPGVRVTKLHVFFDRSVIEVFINDGRRTVTKVVYPGTQKLQREAFADPGGEVTTVKAWRLKAIW